MSSIVLTITPGAGTTSHAIQRSIDSGVFSPLISLNMPMVTYADHDVTAGHDYSYRVISYQGTIASTPSVACFMALTVNPSTISCVVVP